VVEPALGFVNLMRRLTKPLGIGLTLIAVFCGGFYFFYQGAKKNSPKQDMVRTSAVINQPLPKANLVSISGEPLEDERLRRGKIVLVFMMPDCPSCDEENAFIKTVAGSRQDVSFFYVIPFGGKDAVLKWAQGKYSLDPLYDVGSNLSKSLEIYQVPIKIFLEDGIIKRTWLDATDGNQKQAEFKDWLGGL
jgi:hypothetical protein